MLQTKPREYSGAEPACHQENFRLWNLPAHNLTTIAGGILDSQSQYWVKGKVEEIKPFTNSPISADWYIITYTGGGGGGAGEVKYEGCQVLLFV